ncbi:chaperonin Cpn60 [Halobacteriales archaeon QH_3_68_24]|nr:MAG: chaperonin Cpn60 [Halobacteriales archaeon QH_3_68_24]
MTTNDEYTGWSQVPPRDTRAAIRQTAGGMADLVRSTLGPLGLDKMIVRRMPDDELRGFASNDGVAIIEEFEGETDNPVAQEFITLAEDHEDDLGDGVTTMFLLACDLLSASMDLVDRGVHPNDVVEGYSIAAQRTLEHWNEAAIPVAGDGELDRATLETIAMTGMTNGHTGSWPLDEVADTVVDAVLRVSDPASGTTRLDHADTEAVPGGTVSDTELVEGPVLPRDIVDAPWLMPVEGPILLVDGDLKTRELAADVSVSMDREDPGKTARSFNEAEGIAAAIGESGAVAVVTTGDADMQVAYELAGEDAVLVRNTKDTDFEYIRRATGATPVGPVSPGTTVDPDVLGEARVSFRDMGRDDDWLAWIPARSRPAARPTSPPPGTSGPSRRGSTAASSSRSRPSPTSWRRSPRPWRATPGWTLSRRSPTSGAATRRATTPPVSPSTARSSTTCSPTTAWTHTGYGWPASSVPWSSSTTSRGSTASSSTGATLPWSGSSRTHTTRTSTKNSSGPKPRTRPAPSRRRRRASRAARK